MKASHEIVMANTGSNAIQPTLILNELIGAGRVAEHFPGLAEQGLQCEGLLQEGCAGRQSLLANGIFGVSG